MDRNKMAKMAATSFMIVSSVSALVGSTSAVADDKMEKCYGIVKAGMNDCPTATSSCAGSSVKDNQPDAFIMLPVGACKKIVGGNLTESSENKK